MGWDLAVIAIVLLAYSVVSRRLAGGIVTAAIVFVIGGLVCGPLLGVFEAEVESGTIRLLAEITLALVLFTDASGINSRALRHEGEIPTRLLLFGLPLTIAAGTTAAILIFPELGFFEAMVLAVLLAPTDAALGQTVVSDERLPSRLRQGLNVESGLNDGICVPLLFAAIAGAELEESTSISGREILVDLVKEIGIALAVGVVATTIICAVVNESRRRGWLSSEWAQIVPIGAVTIVYTSTAELGGSGFIAAFVAGFLYGLLIGNEIAHETTRLMEEAGGLLSGVTFFVFGAIVISDWLTDFDPMTIVFAVLSLTLIRMIPVGLSFVGSKVRLPTIAFAGWFGPRGLATIVFALILVEDADLLHTSLIVQVAALTVMLSVLAHGVTAPVLTNKYVAWRTRIDGRSTEQAARM